jgi:hypothetical protein
MSIIPEDIVITTNNAIVFRAFDIIVTSENYKELLGFQTVPKRAIIFKGREISTDKLIELLEKIEY